MKYYIPEGTTVFLCKRDPHESQESILQYMTDVDKFDPWTPMKTTRAVTYTDADRKKYQIANRDQCYEFIIPSNDRNVTFLAVYKQWVEVIK